MAAFEYYKRVSGSIGPLKFEIIPIGADDTIVTADMVSTLNTVLYATVFPCNGKVYDNTSKAEVSGKTITITPFQNATGVSTVNNLVYVYGF